MVTWVIEKQINDTRVRWTREIEAICNLTNHKYIELDLSKGIDNIIIPIINDIVVLYGSTNVFDVQKQMQFKPGIFEIDNESKTFENLGEHYLNQDMEVMDIESIFDYMNKSNFEFFFIKADTASKLFNGTVVDSGKINILLNTIRDNPRFTKDMKFCISPHKLLGKEWRLFIVDGEIVAWSQYMDKHRLSVDPSISMETYQYARYIIDNVYNPNDVYVMDICESSDGLKVVEYNTFNCSGLYKCSPNHIVQCVNEFVTRTYL